MDATRLKPDGYVVGVDGCPGGWAAVALSRRPAPQMIAHHVFATAAGLWHAWAGAALILIDIPIGLPDRPGGRRCDVEARRILGRPRGASVFSPPCRAALAADDYRQSCARNRAHVGVDLSRQAFNLRSKIREIDDLLCDEASAIGRLRESHPEVCFSALAGRPMAHNKRRQPGRAERLEVLDGFLPGAEELMERIRAGRLSEVKADDAIDALVLAVTALGHPSDVRTLPAEPPRDALGLPMEIVCPPAARS
jgi:predicted RNase H-like nuclease